MAGTAAGRYSQLEGDRRPYLDRARQCAKLTIPSLLPDEGTGGSTTFVTPYQSVGARGVNNLSSKLLLTLFPPTTNYFKMNVDELTLDKITGKSGMKAEVDKALSAYVGRVMADVEERSTRVTVFEALKLLITTGNGVLYVPDEGSLRFYRLDKFVLKRDPAGNLLELIIKEQIAYSAIPPDVLKMIPVPAAAAGPEGVSPPTEEELKPLDLYTYVYLAGDQYTVFQEIADVIVPGSIGTYPKDRCPYIALRFVKVDGEDYGRSYIEEYLGDLAALEDLSKALVEYAAIASRVNFFVDPNGNTRIKEVSNAKNGDFITGNAEKDVTVLQVQKFQDFRVVADFINGIEQRLAYAFLLNTAIQRPGERVTAEEIRFMARELEDALGGVYSVQSQELQVPFTYVIIDKLERKGQLPQLPNGIVPSVVTGIDALGRGQDLANLDQFVVGALKLAPEAGQYINWQDYLTRRAAALGIDMAGLVKTPEQVAQEQQQAQLMAMIQKLGPQALSAGGGVLQKGMDIGAQGPAQAQAPSQGG